MKYQRMVWIVMALLAMPVGLWSQGTITANSKAVNMYERQLWRMQGNPVGGDQIGSGIGGGIDVNGDGYGDFFVYFGGEVSWKLFYGGNPPDTVADWVLKDIPPVPSYPIIGDFFGEGRKFVGLGSARAGKNGSRYYQLRLFGVDSGRISDTAFAVFDPMAEHGVYFGSIQVVRAEDYDRDGVDDLAVMFAGGWRDTVRDEHPEVWIFKGGSNFQVDTPTVIVRDTDAVVDSRSYAELGDLDGDGYVDMMTVGSYREGKKLKFYWGTETSPWTWRQPDRVVDLTPGHQVVGFDTPVLLDVDGDGVQDLVFRYGVVFRSRVGKSIRTRSLLIDSSDGQLYHPEASFPSHGGYLNDRGKKYEMILMSGGNAGYWFSGGANGPDTTYAAYYRDGWPDETVFGVGQDMGDIDGDGWDDYGAGNPLYLTNHSGVAVIFRGGPDLPSPDSVSGLREVAVEEHRDGLRMWPNPVEEDLTLVWRGDLKRMPSRFEVVNVLGQRVAYGEVEGWRGSAVWRCGDVPPGVYMVMVSDRTGEPITTVSVIKR